MESELQSVTRSWLGLLPADIFGELLLFLDTEDVSNLWCTGDSQLCNHAFLGGRAVKNIVLLKNFGDKHPKSLPLILPSILASDWTHARSLHLTVNTKTDDVQITHFSPNMFPRALTHLELISAALFETLMGQFEQSQMSLKNQCPALQHLLIASSGTFDSELLATFPKLTSLQLETCDSARLKLSHLAPLTDSLQTLVLEFVVHTTLVMDEDPAFVNLEKATFLFKGAYALLPVLPLHLDSLTLSITSEEDLLAHFKAIPRQLQSLELDVKMNIEFSLELAAALPPALTWLKTNNLMAMSAPASVVQALPRTLRTLYLPNLHGTRILPSLLPPSLTRISGMLMDDSVPLPGIPESLTHLRIQSIEDENQLNFLPRGLKTLSCISPFPLEPSLLPALETHLPQLRSLSFRPKFNPRLATMIPRMLTALNLTNVTSQVDIASCLRPADLPPHLTALLLYMHIPTTWWDTIASLKELKRLQFDLRSTCSDEPPPFHLLPRPLELLSIPYKTYQFKFDYFSQLPTTLRELMLTEVGGSKQPNIDFSLDRLAELPPPLQSVHFTYLQNAPDKPCFVGDIYKVSRPRRGFLSQQDRFNRFTINYTLDEW